jgi:alginate O-acetyltransferase complex protein AlgI
MSFVSFEFVALLAVALILLAVFKDALSRKIILLLVSCAFYAYWDWRFLGLLVFVTVLDYYISILLVGSSSPKVRRVLLAASVIANLAVLGFFKYFNFFVDTFNWMLRPVGAHFAELEIILPIGISFYIFETLSYVIDVYRGRAEPANSLLDYAVFITFFPRLVSGPIMRASHFLPQLYRGVQFSRENFIRGAQFFGQGLLKKLVVADTLALLVDRVYLTPNLYSSQTVWLGACAFMIQIYFDFSGYSDMATGISRLMGFELPVNFRLPFTSRNFTEFWQRWHISLSTWLRDYLYVSLGGSRKGNVRAYFNLLVTMLLGGLWHGASWNFVVYGGFHGVVLAFERALDQNRHISREWNTAVDWAKALGVYWLLVVSCVFFRSPSTEITVQVFRKLLFINPDGITWFFLPAFVYIVIVLGGGLFLRSTKIEFTKIDLKQSYMMPLIVTQYLVAFLFASTNPAPFFYFQF